MVLIWPVVTQGQLPPMIRAILRSTFILFITALFALPALAQDDDLDLSLDDIESDDVAPARTNAFDDDDDGGEMEFDVVDTEATVRDIEAQRKAELDLIRVIQRRPFLRRKRFELAPVMGTNINDSLVNFFMAGASGTYHLTEVMAVGLTGNWALGSETDLFDSVITEYDVFPEISKVRWSAVLEYQYAFMYGKFALFNTWIIPWDTYAVLGAGVTQTELATHPTLAVGIGQRYFMNRWFCLNVSLRDGVYNEDYPGGAQIVNNLVFGAGVSFFLPPNFQYRTLK